MPETADPQIDLSKFKTAFANLAGVLGWSPRLTAPLQLFTIAQSGYGMDPQAIPVVALQLMNTHPAVYLAERTLCGIVRRPDLFSVKHSDPAIAAETEAWLWPILDEILSGAVRGFAYGTVGMVFDWERAALRYEVAKPGKKARWKTAAAHTHYARAVEVHPDETNVRTDEFGRFDGLACATGTFGKDRTFLWAWDPEFGALVGQGARRRAWMPYCESLIVTLLRDKYLERSVDAPRIAYVPEGNQTVDGEEMTNAAYVVQLLLDLQGSGAMGLPSVRETGGERKFEIERLEVSEAAAPIFEAALNRCDAQIMLAYLVAPSMGGVDDAGGNAAGRAMDGMLREQIEDLATWLARGLTKIVDVVHRANYDPAKVAPPEVVATDVGKAAARRVYQSVLQLVNAAAGGEIALRTDVPSLLDKLGVPLRDAPPPSSQPAPGATPEGRPPGRPLDTGSEREDRREDAETDEGGEDTGGEDVERDERGEEE